MKAVWTASVVLAVSASLLIYVLHIPLPEGVEDAVQVQRSSTLINAAFYLCVAAWYLGFENPFYPGEIVLSYAKKAQSTEEFPDLKITWENMDEVSVKMYKPKTTKSSTGALVFFHGGGYTYGSPDTYHYLTGRLCQRLQIPVYSVKYTLSPQGKYPDALNEAEKVMKYLEKHHKEHDLDMNKIAIGGDSAGGHLAITVTMKLLTNQKWRPVTLFLIYPATQMLTFNTPSHILYKNDMLLSRTTANAFRLNMVTASLQDISIFNSNNHTNFQIRDNYAKKYQLPRLSNRGPTELDSGGNPSAIDKYKWVYEDSLVSPLFASNEVLSHFPPTLLQTSQFDILKDEGDMFGTRLKRVNVTVTEQVYPSIHGMYNYLVVKHRPAIRALDNLLRYLKVYVV